MNADLAIEQGDGSGERDALHIPGEAVHRRSKRVADRCEAFNLGFALLTQSFDVGEDYQDGDWRYRNEEGKRQPGA